MNKIWDYGERGSRRQWERREGNSKYWIRKQLKHSQVTNMLFIHGGCSTAATRTCVSKTKEGSFMLFTSSLEVFIFYLYIFTSNSLFSLNILKSQTAPLCFNNLLTFENDKELRQKTVDSTPKHTHFLPEDNWDVTSDSSVWSLSPLVAHIVGAFPHCLHILLLFISSYPPHWGVSVQTQS